MKMNHHIRTENKNKQKVIYLEKQKNINNTQAEIYISPSVLFIIVPDDNKINLNQFKETHTIIKVYVF